MPGLLGEATQATWTTQTSSCSGSSRAFSVGSLVGARLLVSTHAAFCEASSSHSSCRLGGMGTARTYPPHTPQSGSLLVSPSDEILDCFRPRGEHELKSSFEQACRENPAALQQ